MTRFIIKKITRMILWGSVIGMYAFASGYHFAKNWQIWVFTLLVMLLVLTYDSEN